VKKTLDKRCQSRYNNKVKSKKREKIMMNYVEFSDNTAFVAESQSYSILAKHFWDLKNHMPLEEFMNKPVMIQFLQYVDSFYGQNGLYADKENFATVSQQKEAIKRYMMSLNDATTWGDGDSLDRERVRYILENELNVQLS
tara:strand:+ start:874 stop:1296 length:423 start_codon:yes stop_codon:yes gene_type:complete